MQEAPEKNIKSSTKDCLSCRIWAGAFHVGLAVYVGSYWRKQKHLASKVFILSFSASEFITHAAKSGFSEEMFRQSFGGYS